MHNKGERLKHFTPWMVIGPILRGEKPVPEDMKLDVIDEMAKAKTAAVVCGNKDKNN